MTAGRPSKYDPKYCDQLREHMGKGFSFESFAATIGVNRDTLYQWAKVHSEFSDAKSDGTDASLYHYEKIFQAGILGKVKNFNSTALIFLMKNRFKWTDRQEIDHGISKNLHEQILDSLSEE